MSTAPVSSVGKAALPKNLDICVFIACLYFHHPRGKSHTKLNFLIIKGLIIDVHTDHLWKTTISVVFNHPSALTLSNKCFNLTF